MESIASKGLEGSLDVVAAHDGRRGQLKVGSFEDLGEPAVDHCRTRARLWIGRIKAAMANKGRADLVMSREAPQKGIVTSGERRDKLLVDTAASRADVAPYGRHAAGRRVPDEIARLDEMKPGESVVSSEQDAVRAGLRGARCAAGYGFSTAHLHPRADHQRRLGAVVGASGPTPETSGAARPTRVGRADAIHTRIRIEGGGEASWAGESA